jgi:hypothetical protein
MEERMSWLPLLTIRRIGIWLCLLLGFTTVSLVVTHRTWDGCFDEAEFQIKFIDVEGNPVAGVTLRVTDRMKERSFHYPVSDYSEKHSPVSGNDGVITFHHVWRGAEFGGNCCHLFFLIPLGKCSWPVYHCEFLLGKAVIYRCLFSDLYRGIDRKSLPVKQRIWIPLDDAPRRSLDETGVREFKVIQLTVTSPARTHEE